MPCCCCECNGCGEEKIAKPTQSKCSFIMKCCRSLHSYRLHCLSIFLCLCVFNIVHSFHRFHALPAYPPSRRTNHARTAAAAYNKYEVPKSDMQAIEHAIKDIMMKPSLPPILIDPIEKEIALDLRRFEPRARHGIVTSLKQLKSCMENGDMERFITWLKALAARTKTDITLANALLPWLEEMTDQLSYKTIANWIWSLGRLGLSTRDTRHNKLILHALIKLNDAQGLSGRDLTTAFIGLRLAQVTQDDLFPSIHSSLAEKVNAVVDEFNVREISNILYALPKIGFPATFLSSSSWSTLWKKLQLDIDEVEPQEATMTIYSLGLLGVSVDQLEELEQEVVFKMVLKAMVPEGSRQACQQNANVYLGLAKMGIRYVSIPSNVRERMEECLLKSNHFMNEQEVANVMYSFGVMNAPWVEINMKLQNRLFESLMKIFPSMTMQGISNTVYGMALARVKWIDLPRNLQDSINGALMNIFRKYIEPTRFSQNIGNTVYALGVMSVPWESLSIHSQNALLEAFRRHAKEFTSQELSNFVYGLGCMSAPLRMIRPDVVDVIATRLVQLQSNLGQQEICSLLHGLTNMVRSWDEMPFSLRTAIFQIISRLGEYGPVCLSCSTYSLGRFGLLWSDLPSPVSTAIENELIRKQLTDQSLSNTLYGMGLMQVKWFSLKEEVRNALANLLSSPTAFVEYKSQHISNTLWGLAKMEALWRYLPREALEAVLIHMLPGSYQQELSNVIYALGVLEARWDDLSLDVLQALTKVAKSRIDKMSVQELANIMYAFALMTYDCDYDYSTTSTTTTTTSTITSTTNLVDTVKREKMSLLWTFHHVMLEKFSKLELAEYNQENYDQFSIYFEFLSVLPGGKKLIEETFKHLTGRRRSGPAGNVPSRLHAMTANALEEALIQFSSKFSIFNEFSGLGGVFPIDVAIYYDDKLFAFVEVDGDFHYGPDQQLQRKDRLKEFIYNMRYPDVPLYRIRFDQIHSLGAEQAGKALAMWITRQVQLPHHSQQQIETKAETAIVEETVVTSSTKKQSTRKRQKKTSSEEEVVKEEGEGEVAVEVEVSSDSSTSKTPTSRKRKASSSSAAAAASSSQTVSNTMTEGSEEVQTRSPSTRRKGSRAKSGAAAAAAIQGDGDNNDIVVVVAEEAIEKSKQAAEVVEEGEAKVEPKETKRGRPRKLPTSK